VVITKNVLYLFDRTKDYKKYQCKGCDKSFLLERGLHRHILAYPGPHQFHCNFCKLTFLRENLLLKHQKLKHPATSGSVPVRETAELSCQECGKLFVSEEGREYHRSTQHGDGVSRKAETSNGHVSSELVSYWISERSLRFDEIGNSFFRRMSVSQSVCMYVSSGLE